MASNETRLASALFGLSMSSKSDGGLDVLAEFCFIQTLKSEKINEK